MTKHNLRMTPFDVDNQTLHDLEIFETASGGKCIFSFFDSTSTVGGKEKLKDIFLYPQTDIIVIEERKSLIQYLLKHKRRIEFNRESLDFIEYYLRQNDKPLQSSVLNVFDITTKFFSRNSQQYYLKQKGVAEVLKLLHLLYDFCLDTDIDQAPDLLKTLNSVIHTLMKRKEIKNHVLLRPQRFKIFELEKYDFLIRSIEITQIRKLLEICYLLDAYLSVARTAEKYELSFPIYHSSPEKSIVISGLFHLFVVQPVKNDIEFRHDKNVCFITGVNMAGKSTLLKSVGVCVYLAHLGFPVPAQNFETAIFDGLVTTINLSDNLKAGYSHFYNEVLRVKNVALKVASSKNMVVIFDELFRGTNVKDAYDASLSLITAFSLIRKSLFIISTHIVEVAQKLEKNGNIDFRFLETTMNDGKPFFGHKLKSGITDDRIGMWIIENEGILDILRNAM